MSSIPLRIYHGPQTDPNTTVSTEPETRRAVTLSLGEVLPLLADAVRALLVPGSAFDSAPSSITRDFFPMSRMTQHGTAATVAEYHSMGRPASDTT